MKKKFTLGVFFMICVTMNAQLIKNDFMEGTVLGQGIEVGTYLANSEPIMANQWNKSPRDTGGSNPIVVSALSYSGYYESGKGNAVELLRLGTGSRLTTYSLTNNDAYNEGVYYLTCLISVGSNTIAGDNIGVIMFDGNHTGDFQRVCLCVKANSERTAFSFGVSPKDGSGAVYESTTRNFNATYLVVLKYDIETGDAELFVNPAITNQEPTPVKQLSTPKELKSVRAITVRQRTNHSCILGGMRLSTTWEAAIGLDNSILNSVNSLHADGTIIKEEYYNLSGIKINKPEYNGMYIKKAIYDNGSVVSDKVFVRVK